MFDTSKDMAWWQRLLLIHGPIQFLIPALLTATFGSYDVGVIAMLICTGWLFWANHKTLEDFKAARPDPRLYAVQYDWAYLYHIYLLDWRKLIH